MYIEAASFCVLVVHDYVESVFHRAFNNACPSMCLTALYVWIFITCTMIECTYIAMTTLPSVYTVS